MQCAAYTVEHVTFLYFDLQNYINLNLWQSLFISGLFTTVQ